MERACPICAGMCGSRWRRAVLDSQDAVEAHWIGNCGLAVGEGGERFQWYLMEPSLPDLTWARLRIRVDGSAEVRDNGGAIEFADAEAARHHLSEDEFQPFDESLRSDALEEGVDLSNVEPPGDW
jgi:hypothetical protein